MPRGVRSAHPRDEAATAATRAVVDRTREDRPPAPIGREAGQRVLIDAGAGRTARRALLALDVAHRGVGGAVDRLLARDCAVRRIERERDDVVAGAEIAEIAADEQALARALDDGTAEAVAVGALGVAA